MSQALINELSRENLCTHFVLPLLRLNKFSFLASNFLNCYLSVEGHFIVAHVVEGHLLSRKVFKNSYYYRTCRKRGISGIYLVYRVPPEWHRDIDLFMQGKFSRMSDKAKETIIRYSSLPYQEKEGGRTVTDGRLLALDKHPLLKQMWERAIHDPESKREEQQIPDELLSIPGDESYIKMEDLM